MTASLYLLARPQFAAEYKQFLAALHESWHETDGTDAEKLIEFAGRICYMSFGKLQSPRDNATYIRNLIAQRHDSVLEHATWTFLLDGVSRSFTHQLVRHRIGFSFSQLSQQYYDHSTVDFVIPEGLGNDPIAFSAWRSAVEAARDAYNIIEAQFRFVDGRAGKEKRRAVRSVARSVLPNATATKIVVSANGRSLRHFLMLRGATEGDLEMRQVSGLIYDMLKKEAPSLVRDFSNIAERGAVPLIQHIDNIE